jgi:formate dehydrogenase assembly factor FdhD
MPGLGRRTFIATEVLTAANVNGYLMDQSVMVFAGTAARSSAIGTALSEGMVTYRSDFNVLEVYDGASFVGINERAITNATVAAYTATLANANGLIVASSTAAQTITVPDVFEIGQAFEVIRDGAGTVSLAAGTGATSWAGAGTAGTAVTFKIDQQYNGAQVFKVAANAYRVIGKITV